MGHEQDSPSGGVANAVTVAGAVEQIVQAHHITGDVHVHGPAAPEVPQPRQLPRDITFFTGRDAELGRLDALLSGSGPVRSSTVVISAIAGTAGIGKTSLAVRWAHRRSDRFPDGQLYVNLRGYDSRPPATANQVLDEFLRALGVSGDRMPQDADAKASLYRSLLAGRRMLVVLDNAATPEQVRPLLPNEPACLVLVTSRSRLSGLVARDGAHRISLDLLVADEACALLRDVIGHDRTDREKQATAELAHRCAYLPLALRIAAERVASHDHLTIADLVQELAIEHHRLDVLTADDDEDTAVRTVFSWSYHALADDTRQAFRLLGLHPGPSISLAAATALTGATTGATRQRLDALAGVHLLTQTGPDRYQLHDLLHTYAADRAACDEPDEPRQAATQRLFDWYLHTAHSALRASYSRHPDLPIDPPPAGCQPLGFTDRDHVLSWFVAEHANLMAVLRHAPSVGQHTIGWQLPLAMDAYLTTNHPTADGITVHQLALTAAQRAGPQFGRRWIFLHLGESYLKIRRYNEALVCLQRGLEVARQGADKFTEGTALLDLAYANNELGHYADAAAHSRQALEINRATGYTRNEALSLIHLGRALCGLGQLDPGITYLKQGLTTASTNDEAAMQALAQRYLARAHYQQGHHDNAVNLLTQAAVGYRTLHYDHAYAATLDDLATVLNDSGTPNQAHDTWQEALTILTNVDPHHATQIREQLDALNPSDTT